MQETRVWSLGWEDPPEKELTTHPSNLAWEIPWTEELGRLQSTGPTNSQTWLSTDRLPYSGKVYFFIIPTSNPQSPQGTFLSAFPAGSLTVSQANNRQVSCYLSPSLTLLLGTQFIQWKALWPLPLLHLYRCAETLFTQMCCCIVSEVV